MWGYIVAIVFITAIFIANTVVYFIERKRYMQRLRSLKRKMIKAQKEHDELLQLIEEIRQTPPRFIRSGDLPVEMTEVTEDETW